MSADRYSNCPNCQKIEELEIEKLKKKLAEDYGKIEANLWVAHSREIEDREEDIENSNLREDWELDIQDGIYIRYHANCSSCGFDYEFKKDHEPIEIPGMKIDFEISKTGIKKVSRK